MAANRSKLLGDGRAHGLAGGSATVATPTPGPSEHRFDAFGRCQCGVERALSEGKVFYKTAAGWALGKPVCSVVWQ